MKTNNPRDVLKPFTGSIDELCEKLENTDCDAVDRMIDGDPNNDFRLTDEEALEMIKETLPGITPDDARRVLDEIKEEEVSEAIQKLMEDGLVEIVKYGEGGEPLYGLTELGKQFADKLIK